MSEISSKGHITGTITPKLQINGQVGYRQVLEGSIKESLLRGYSAYEIAVHNAMPPLAVVTR